MLKQFMIYRVDHRVIILQYFLYQTSKVYSQRSMGGIGSIGPIGGQGFIGPIGGLGSMGKIPISGLVLYTQLAHSITHTHINAFILQY